MGRGEPYDYLLPEFTNHKLLTPARERELLLTVHDGCLPGLHLTDHSCPERDELVQMNIRLVLKVVQRFAKRSDEHFDDLVSAGILGLIEGVDRFNIHAKTLAGSFMRFSTYSVWWIQAKVRDEMAEHNTQIISHQSYHEMFKRARRELMSLSGDPDVETEHVLAYLQNVFSWSDAKVESVRQDLERHTVSMQLIVSDRSTSIEDQPIKNLLLQEDSDRLNDAIRELEFADVFILMERFVNNATHVELGRMMGVSQERARQRENEALRRLWFLLNTETE